MNIIDNIRSLIRWHKYDMNEDGIRVCEYCCKIHPDDVQLINYLHIHK